ncbi:arylesterase [Francisella tularensis]|uniref:GDSL-like Lipase/Acylhydrolase family protein n=3 Tax=Francisella tularensis TaxID=263 RepID=Q5NG41_FRATT|nr:arylesterase [Francisella tularensis]ADA78696.1 GDSL-like Lipase/Acylhydrolase family protein [Francisella tularensis subsp. tularensis NE061598]AFB79102.1 Acyl-CoA thioesterase I [Francisella tularensis subsp. tularensis TIGB03]AFB80647.1 Acyl-CoA thioesterase I [Francisella tularensis subsp. tularensis TI0902]AJI70012.1 GDSL-like Lipase/Acylhydrolase family protein [Francisella tularensis subsp. tularensis SCHU S4]AJI72289.1 GDSL-like Lipase/Acylhydrolase family protein [Francisella tular
MRKIILAIVLAVLVYLVYYVFFENNYNNWPIVNAKPQGETIVAFGDSLTAGYGVDKKDNYPSQLAKMLNQPVINMGISGETTQQALLRINKVIAKKPKIVLITLGGNDLKKKIPAGEAFDNLKQIVNILQANGALVVIGGIDIPYYKNDYAQDYIEFAKNNGCLLVPNTLSGLIGHSELMIDAVHPNAKGYNIMAKEFYDVIDKYLAQK